MYLFNYQSLLRERKKVKNSCRICANSSGNKIHTSREMMYGTFDSFDYIECTNCRCVQIDKYQRDIAKHYPDNYYSFADTNHKSGFIKATKKKLRAQIHFSRSSTIKTLLTKVFKSPKLNIGILNANLNFNSKVLDVGCGSGELLFDLHSHGFTNLTGVDPHIQDTINKHGISIKKTNVYSIKGKYDFIMLNHSFEHMEEQLKVLTHLQSLITENGEILIRIPIASSYAWKHYGVNWVQLDPPRHYYIHTVKSMNILASKSKLVVEKIIYDSESFQFIGSEFYKRDIPMPPDLKTYTSTLDGIFTKEQVKAFKIRATELNKEKQGDQACFYLKKVTEK